MTHRDLRRKLGSITARVRTFVRRHRRLAQEALRQQVRRLVLVAIASALSAGAHGSTLALVVFVVRELQIGSIASLPIFSSVTSHPLLLFVLLTGTIFGLQLVASLAGYSSTILSRRIGRTYHERATRRILDALAAPLDFRSLREPLSETHLRRLLIGYSRILGVLAETISKAISPASHLAMGIVALVIIDPVISLLLFIISLGTLPAYYLLSGNFQRESRMFYESATGISLKARSYLDLLLGTNAHDRKTAEVIAARFGEEKEVRDYIRGFDLVALATHRSMFLTGVFHSILLLIIFSVLCYPPIVKGAPWGGTVPYITALLYTFGCARMLSTQLAVINRFYPHLSAYQELLDAAKYPRPDQASARPSELTMRASPEGHRGGEAQATIARGSHAALVLPTRASPFELFARARPAIDASSLAPFSWAEATYLSGRFTRVPGTVGSNLRLPEGSHASMSRMLVDLGLAEEIEQLPKSLETELTDEVWSGLSSSLQAAIRLRVAGGRAAPITLIEQSAFAGIQESFFWRLIAFQDDMILLIYGASNQFKWRIADTFIVVEENGLISIGDWEWFRSWSGAEEDLAASASLTESDALEDLSLDP